MNCAIRSVRTHPPSVILTPLNHIGRRISGVSFRQVTNMAGKPENTNKTNDSSNEEGLVLINLGCCDWLLIVVVNYC